MRFFRVGFLFATAMSVATSALGAAGAITPKVSPLTSPVTYSTNSSPPLETYVAYTLNFTNTGRNTINDVRFTFVASATDTAETVALFNPAAICRQTARKRCFVFRVHQEATQEAARVFSPNRSPCSSGRR